MKRILVFIGFLVIWYGAFSQVSHLSSFTIKNASSKYGEIISPPTLIFDMSNGNVWIITSLYPPDSTLNTTSNKIGIEAVESTPTDTYNYLNLTPQSDFPDAIEGRIFVLNGTNGNIVYYYSSGEWIRLMPLNKNLNGFQMIVPDNNQ